MAKVKYQGSAPAKSPKAVGYAEIKGQGKIPYGYCVDTPKVSDKPREMKARGAGAAKRGTKYMGY